MKPLEPSQLEPSNELQIKEEEDQQDLKDGNSEGAVADKAQDLLEVEETKKLIEEIRCNSARKSRSIRIPIVSTFADLIAGILGDFISSPARLLINFIILLVVLSVVLYRYGPSKAPLSKLPEPDMSLHNARVIAPSQSKSEVIILRGDQDFKVPK